MVLEKRGSNEEDQGIKADFVVLGLMVRPFTRRGNKKYEEMMEEMNPVLEHYDFEVSVEHSRRQLHFWF